MQILHLHPLYPQTSEGLAQSPQEKREKRSSSHCGIRRRAFSGLVVGKQGTLSSYPSFEQDYMGQGPNDAHAHLIGDLLKQIGLRFPPCLPGQGI